MQTRVSEICLLKWDKNIWRVGSICISEYEGTKAERHEHYCYNLSELGVLFSLRTLIRIGTWILEGCEEDKEQLYVQAGQKKKLCNRPPPLLF
jgi:hypothetical protein